MKTRSKQALSLLLALLMVISLFGGITIVGADGEPDATYYQSVDALTADKAVMVVAQNGDKYYALSYDGSSLGAKEVFVVGGFASAQIEDPNELLWIPRDDNVLESALDTTKAIFAGSGGFMIYDCTGSYRRTFVFTDGQVKMHNKFYLTFDGSAFNQSQTAGDAAEILLFTSVECGVKDSALTADAQYAVVAVYDGKFYALTNDGSTPGATQVSVDIAAGIVYGIEDDTALWIPRSDGVLESAADTTKAIFAGSGGFMIYDCTGSYRRTFVYNPSEAKVLMHNKFYLTFDGSAFSQSQSAGDAAQIVVFKWISLAKQYTITFDANADGIDGLTGTKTEGKDYVISESLVQDGYAFDGWNTAADGSGTAYAVGDKITEDGDLTLYAQWSQVQTETYTRTNELTEHYEYVVVTNYGGKDYAISYDGSSVGFEEVTVDGNSVTTDSLGVRWILSEDNELETVVKSGTFLYPYSGGMTYSSGRKLKYDGQFLTFSTSSGTGYFTFDGTRFFYIDYAGDSAPESAATISLFVREIEWVEPPQAVPAVYPEPEPITRSAVKNADGSITLAFSSDVHYDGENLNLKTWLDAADLGYIDAFGFCGDMGSAYASNADKFWTWTGAIMDYMDGLVDAGTVGTTIYTHGNHEWFPSAGGDFANEYQNYPAAQRLLQVGPGLVTDDYIIYCFGAGEIAATMKYDYNVYDVAEMEEYLDSAPTDIPIFVLTHFPLHYWYGRGEERYMKHANEVIDVLNEHPNVVVLWGHNHSDFDDNYYTPLFAGDEIVINPKGETRTLNFSYMAAGCTADAEYTGPSAGSAATQTKGLVVTIDAEGGLSYKYMTMDGQEMNIESPWMVRFRKGLDNYDVFETQYVEDGKTAKKLRNPRATGYEFEGWFTYENGKEIEFGFDQPITRNMLVTARFKELPVEDLTITPESTVDDEPFTMTATGLLPRYTNFDIGSLLGSEEPGPFTYALWFEKTGTFSFNREMTLTHQYFDSDFNSLGTDTVVLAANEVVTIGDGVYSEVNGEQVVWSEFAVTLDDGNSLMIIDSEEPGNYSNSEPNTHLSDFPGTVTGLPMTYYEYLFAVDEEDEDPQVFEKLAGDVFDFANVVSPKSDDYNFMGWNTEPDGSGETYGADATLDTDDDLIFYAIWKEMEIDDEDDVIPGGSGGSSGSSGSSSDTTTGTVGETVAAAEPVVEIDEKYQDQDVEVKVTENEDGSITIDVTASGLPIELDDGVKVTVPVETKPGQVLVVVDEDGNETVLKKSVTEDGEITALLDGSATIKVVENAKEFDDVAEDDWFAEAVDFVTSHEIFQGMGDGEFGPQDTMTRAMMATVLFRLEGEPAVSGGKTFADVESGKWYTAAVNWASETGIMNGYGESFGTNDAVTREQMAVLLYNYVKSLGIETEAGSTAGFSDAGELHSWGEEAMAWAVGAGIFQGDGTGRLNPGGNATRAEVATLMMRIVQYIVK